MVWAAPAIAGLMVRDGKGGRGHRGSVASVLHLVRPTRPTRVAYRATIVGFPLCTFAVICDAIWAEAAWGAVLGRDPREASFVAWASTRAAVLDVLGLAVILFNLMTFGPALLRRGGRDGRNSPDTETSGE